MTWRSQGVVIQSARRVLEVIYQEKGVGRCLASDQAWRRGALEGGEGGHDKNCRL